MAKLDPFGNLVYATHPGDSDVGRAVAVDRLCNACVLGPTASTDLPTTAGAFGADCCSDGECDFTGTFAYVDAFVTRLNPSGTGLVYSSYLAGSLIEFVGRIAVDPKGNAYFTGLAGPALPATLGAFQSSPSEGSGAYAARIGVGLVIPPLDLIDWVMLVALAVLLAVLVVFGCRQCAQEASECR